jgi:hypothetical protein
MSRNQSTNASSQQNKVPQPPTVPTQEMGIAKECTNTREAAEERSNTSNTTQHTEREEETEGQKNRTDKKEWRFHLLCVSRNPILGLTCHNASQRCVTVFHVFSCHFFYVFCLRAFSHPHTHSVSERIL